MRSYEISGASKYNVVFITTNLLVGMGDTKNYMNDGVKTFYISFFHALFGNVFTARGSACKEAFVSQIL